MIDTSDVIATIALAVSVVAFTVSAYVALKKEGRDTWRFKQDKKETAIREARGLSAIYQEGPTPVESGYEYRFELVNASHDPIDNPEGWLVDDVGTLVSDRVLGKPAYLMPDERGELHVIARSIGRPLALNLGWEDVRHHLHPEKTSGVDIPLEPKVGFGRGHPAPPSS